MTPVPALVRRVGSRLLRQRLVNAAVRRIAAVRGCALTLVYHRLIRDGRPGAVVPTVPADVFRRHLDVLGEVGELVAVTDLLDGRRPLAPRFAVTFDDDYPSHAEVALPLLADRRVPATFFLSGRSLHGLGPYWFQTLDAAIDSLGFRTVCDALEIEAPTPGALAIACEQSADLQRRVLALPAPAPAVLAAEDIARLPSAGMAVGFHTIRHPLLPQLPSAGEVDDALTDGREALARKVGGTVRLFAYPHGKGDARVAARVRAAGYSAAWTGQPAPIRPRQDPYLLGRWEPGPLVTDDFLVQLAVRLHRTAPDA